MRLPPGLAAAVAHAGVDPGLPEPDLERVIGTAIADRQGDIDQWYWADLGSWCVELLSPDEEEFGAPSLAVALAACLVWMMDRAGEFGTQAVH